MRQDLLSGRAARFTESVIRGMTVLARRHSAVNLAQGMPDFPAPDALKDAACRAIRDDVNQYAITWGARPLREAIVEHAARHLGLDYDPETEVTVTCGATEAMLVALLGVINPGDAVIVPEPFYENYWPDCILAGAEPRFVPAPPPGWDLDFDALAAAFAAGRVKAMLLCHPNNPTGVVLDADRLRAIADLCLRHDALLICDEIYEHILYDGRVHRTPAAIEGMRERTVVIGGMSKTYSVTGWRVGTILAPAALTRVFRQVHDFVSIGAAAPLQEAGAVAYRLPPSYYDRLRAEYQARRDRFLPALAAAGFRFRVPEGAYYVMADFRGVPAARPGEDDVAFARRLVTDFGVATVPGSSFFREGSSLGRDYVRFCFCKTDATLDAAADRLRALTAA